MVSTDEFSIERLALGVVDRSLPKSEWTHEAHFAAALWLLRHRPELATPEGMRRLITGYNETTGTANTDSTGYHHTITIASMRAAGEHLASRADEPLSAVLKALIASPLGHPDWLLSHWTRETLFSVAARREWVEPDVAALPF